MEKNVIHIENALYSKWLNRLDEAELFVYWQGMIGSAISDYVCIDDEDIDELGGLVALAHILENLENKAEELKMYNFWYKRIIRVVDRVRRKFKVSTN